MHSKTTELLEHGRTKQTVTGSLVAESLLMTLNPNFERVNCMAQIQGHPVGTDPRASYTPLTYLMTRQKVTRMMCDVVII